MTTLTDGAQVIACSNGHFGEWQRTMEWGNCIYLYVKGQGIMFNGNVEICMLDVKMVLVCTISFNRWLEGISGMRHRYSGMSEDT